MLAEQESNLTANAYTISESKFETHHHVRAIYKDDEVIGMYSYCYEDDSIDAKLYYLLLDKYYQGKGYASKALELLVVSPMRCIWF